MKTSIRKLAEFYKSMKSSKVPAEGDTSYCRILHLGQQGVLSRLVLKIFLNYGFRETSALYKPEPAVMQGLDFFEVE
jgi:hypothetical protein